MVRFMRSTCPLVQGCLGFVSRWSMSFWAQAYSKACAQTGSPASSAALMSGAAELVLPGVVKWGPVVGEEGMDPVRDSGDQAAQEVPRGAARHLLMQLDEAELRRSV